MLERGKGGLVPIIKHYLFKKSSDLDTFRVDRQNQIQY